MHGVFLAEKGLTNRLHIWANHPDIRRSASANPGTLIANRSDVYSGRTRIVTEVHMSNRRGERIRCHQAARQRGQGMSEYIIITALVAVAGIGLFAAFGDTLQNQLAGMSQELAGQSGATDIERAGTAAKTARSRASQSESLSNYTQQTNAGGESGGS